MKYLYIIQQAMVWILTIYWVYQLIVSLCSLVKLKDKPLVEEKDHKFMAILPAHNEENVIGNLIDSLKKQDYPANLIDIYVIADNCTDNTVKIAKEAGAIVLERKEDDPKKRTKGAALQWFLKQKIEENADLQNALKEYKAVVQALQLVNKDSKYIFEEMYIKSRNKWDIIRELNISEETYKRRHRKLIYTTYEELKKLTLN